jgi:hypothetical protein
LKCDSKESGGSALFEPESPYIIVCEGFHDMALVCALLGHLNITNCDVTYPKKVDGGNGKEAINAVVKLLAGRADDISGILVVADADESPTASFEKLSTAFVEPLRPPPTSFSIHQTRQHRTGIFLSPGAGKTGELEHLLLEAVKAEDADALKCIEDFENCCGTTKDWAENKRAKMRLACYIASHCQNDPCCSPAFIWTRKNKVIDIGSPAFQELANCLIDFTSDRTDPNKHSSKPL